MEILYIFLYVLGIAGVAIGVTYLIKKFNLKKEDVVDGIDIGMAIVTFAKNVAVDMGTSKEDAEKYGKLAFDTLEFMKAIVEGNKEKQIQEGIVYAFEHAEFFGIELNEEREYIISTLIKLAFNVYYAIEKNKE
jgi:hypothetical protein